MSNALPRISPPRIAEDDSHLDVGGISARGRKLDATFSGLASSAFFLSIQAEAGGTTVSDLNGRRRI